MYFGFKGKPFRKQTPLHMFNLAVDAYRHEKADSRIKRPNKQVQEQIDSLIRDKTRPYVCQSISKDSEFAVCWYTEYCCAFKNVWRMAEAHGSAWDSFI